MFKIAAFPAQGFKLKLCCRTWSGVGVLTTNRLNFSLCFSNQILELSLLLIFFFDGGGGV